MGRMFTLRDLREANHYSAAAGGALGALGAS